MFNQSANKDVNVAQSELHVFVLWAKARSAEKKIIEDIKNNFQIVEIYEIEWSKKHFKQNTIRFYGEDNHTTNKIKARGDGKFLLIIVKDDAPKYEFAKLLGSYEIVNLNMFNSKTKYRKLAFVHASDSLFEAHHDLVLFLGKSYGDYFKENGDKKFSGEYVPIKRDVPGAEGWKSLSELFYVLNETCNYVVLNSDENAKYIEILADDFERFLYIANAKHKCGTSNYYLDVNGQKISLKLSYTGDKTYCLNWQQNMLETKRVCETGCYILDETSEFYKSIYDSICKNPEVYSVELENYLKENDFCNAELAKKPKNISLEEQLEKMTQILQTKYNLSQITPLHVLKKTSSGFNMFFTAFDTDNNKLFIKCGGDEYSAKKEFDVMQTLYAQDSRYFPKPYLHRDYLGEEFIATEFIEGKLLHDILRQKTLSQAKMQKIIDSLYEIACILYKNKFIHRDVNPKNLIVKEDGSTVLIDFQHLLGKRFKELKANINEPKKLRGTNKKHRPGPYTWDDMYSFYKIMLEFKDKNLQNYNEKLNDIKSKIGHQRVYFLNNKFAFQSYWSYNFFIFYKFYDIVHKPLRKLKRLLTKKR